MKYRSNIVKSMLENPNIGHGREQQTVQTQENMRLDYLQKYGFDIREEWTALYPRRFPKGYKPKYVDWEKESVFKRYSSNEEKFEYYVVPNMAKYNLSESLEKLALGDTNSGGPATSGCASCGMALASLASGIPA